ncbi:D-ribose pyranase [Deinococcus gobiensis]|uniref:D-ribose pyranase n=1 Tax=Deinococcus gobiensis (strain DSM 21396 / JCM 16679 / CGMCC 1.7299 / I-0) TaxID=745776 RepID=H8H116_DEIGI|nr:D-ribose pyranase [Deinococcus gobiensis]AFD27035.1 Ribose transport permease protein [Deinococcus gobiensis I-0]
MKRRGLLHPDLSALVARAGHTQTIVLADTGLPVPAGTPCIELGVTAGLPALLDVLRAVLTELVVEGATVAAETRQRSPEWYAGLREVLGEVLEEAPAELPHEALKAALPHALAVVRTGETTPYANVILHCGVNF